MTAIHILGGGGLFAILCLMLCDPLGCNPPGFSVCGIFQARKLEWVAISFFRGFFWAGIEPTSSVSPTVSLLFWIPSHLGLHRALSRVPCAVQSVLNSNLLVVYTYVTPNFPTHPTPSFTLWYQYVCPLHLLSVVNYVLMGFDVEYRCC